MDIPENRYLASWLAHVGRGIGALILLLVGSISTKA